MNREQRRRAAGQLSEGRISPAAIKQYEAGRESDITYRVVHDMNIAILMMLHDKFGFGTVRLKRAFDYMVEAWDGIEKNYVSIEDMEKTLKEETGLDFSSHKP